MDHTSNFNPSCMLLFPKYDLHRIPGKSGPLWRIWTDFYNNSFSVTFPDAPYRLFMQHSFLITSTAETGYTGHGCGLGLDVSVSRPCRDVPTSRLGLGVNGLVHIADTGASSSLQWQGSDRKLGTAPEQITEDTVKVSCPSRKLISKHPR